MSYVFGRVMGYFPLYRLPSSSAGNALAVRLNTEAFMLAMGLMVRTITRGHGCEAMALIETETGGAWRGSLFP